MPEYKVGDRIQVQEHTDDPAFSPAARGSLALFNAAFGYRLGTVTEVVGTLDDGAGIYRVTVDCPGTESGKPFEGLLLPEPMLRHVVQLGRTLADGTVEAGEPVPLSLLTARFGR